MKNIIIILLTVFTFNNCQAQSWSWAKKSGTSEGDNATMICKDNSGNIYTSYIFYGHNATIGNQSFTIKGKNDIFIAKYNADGNLIWVKQIGGFNDPYGASASFYYEYNYGLMYDSFSNSILVCGSYSQSINLGCGIMSTPNTYQSYGYLAKLSSDGTCVWSKSIGSSTIIGHRNICKTITSDELGNTYATVWSDHSDTLGVFTPNVKLLKFDALGNQLWAKKIIRGYDNDVKGISVVNNFLFLTGNNNNVSTLKIDTLTLNTNNKLGHFISKFDLDGNVIWAKIFATDTNGYYIDINKIEHDSQNNLYTCGSFNGSSSIINNTTYTSANTTSGAYIIKFDFDGNVIWVKSPKASEMMWTSDIYTDSNGDSYISGTFAGNAYFDNDTILINNSNYQMFIVVYNSLGIKTGFVTNNNADCIGLVVNAPNSIVACGTIYGPAQFGGTSLICNDYADAYIAKYDGFLSVPENTRFAKGNNDKLLYIYANPNNGRCNIQIPKEFKTENSLVLRVFDTTGKTIQQKTLINNGEAINIDLEAEAKGTYNASISNGTTTYNGVIVFE